MEAKELMIDERADSHAGVSTNPHAMYNEGYVLATRYASYKEGATEQKALDVQDAMEAFWEVIAPHLPNMDVAEELSDRWLKRWVE